ncbi:MAG: hypothetical protein JOZ62_20490, partial [Acidobacteriaceae bacterium]|nr:hypothetical protein [Acidobacteriaceae bacterium]
LECEYLQEAHRREKPVPVSEKALSNADVVVTEDFLSEEEELVVVCAHALVHAALRTSGALDTDVLAALEALIQTHRTLESGLVYETVSTNAIAAGIQRSFTASMADYQKAREERDALSPVRNSDILRVLVFLHRVGRQNSNGRPRGRMYLDLLRQMTPEAGVQERQPSIIL